MSAEMFAPVFRCAQSALRAASLRVACRASLRVRFQKERFAAFTIPGRHEPFIRRYLWDSASHSRAPRQPRDPIMGLSSI